MAWMHLNLGVREPGEKPSGGETRSSVPEEANLEGGGGGWGPYPLVTMN